MRGITVSVGSWYSTDVRLNDDIITDGSVFSVRLRPGVPLSLTDRVWQGGGGLAESEVC